MPLLAGLTQTEIQRATSTLKKLFKYVNLENVYLVGGLVVGYYMSESGKPYQRERAFKDLDFVFTNPSDIGPAVTKEFMVHHYHKDEWGTYLVLVDPVNAIKIDLFDSKARPVIESTTVTFDGKQIKIPTLEDQFMEYVRDCYLIVNMTGFKGKDFIFANARSLRDTADMEKAQKVYEKVDNKNFPPSAAWIDKKTSEMPANINEVYEKAFETAEKHPERIISTSYSQMTGPNECQYCVKNDSNFPLTPVDKIFEAMDWAK